ncbi:MAG: preprotein translocase subunit YajC [Desulfovibrionaceae bacterium]
MLIDSAYAMGTLSQPGGESNIFVSLIPMLLMVVIFYFLLIRPQQKKAKEHQKMIDSLQKGAHIITSSGIYGQITEVHTAYFIIDLGNVKVKITKGSIAGIAEESK